MENNNKLGRGSHLPFRYILPDSTTFLPANYFHRHRRRMRLTFLKIGVAAVLVFGLVFTYLLNTTPSSAQLSAYADLRSSALDAFDRLSTKFGSARYRDVAAGRWEPSEERRKDAELWGTSGGCYIDSSDASVKHDIAKESKLRLANVSAWEWVAEDGLGPMANWSSVAFVERAVQSRIGFLSIGDSMSDQLLLALFRLLQSEKSKDSPSLVKITQTSNRYKNKSYYNETRIYLSEHHPLQQLLMEKYTDVPLERFEEPIATAIRTDFLLNDTEVNNLLLEVGFNGSTKAIGKGENQGDWRGVLDRYAVKAEGWDGEMPAIVVVNSGMHWTIPEFADRTPSISENDLLAAYPRLQPQAAKLVWTSLEELIKLAHAAQIPVCGGAIGVARELIDIFNAVGDNQKACMDLLKATAQHGEMVWQLTGSTSGNRSECLRGFGSELDNVKRLVQMQVLRGRVARFILRKELSGEIRDCKERLVVAHQAFKDAISNIVVANTHETNLALLRNQAAIVPQDPFRIMGARALNCYDVEIVGNMEDSRIPGSFWTGMVTVKIDEAMFVAKVYRDTEAQFLRDIVRLAKLHYVRLLAIVIDDSTYHASTDTATSPQHPSSSFMGNILRVLWMENGSSSVSRTNIVTNADPHLSSSQLLDLRDAAQFLVDKNVRISPTEAKKIFQDATIDDQGNIVIAPLDFDPMGTTGEGSGSSDEPRITGFLGLGLAGKTHAMEYWVAALDSAYSDSNYRFPAQGVVQFTTDKVLSGHTSVIVFDSAPFFNPLRWFKVR
ncbi:hypothetical protein FRB99_008851 [Tulasnella sp. 403]|nr:hypothetical protein FRB99_008851 [Tulasnella sp. 403]